MEARTPAGAAGNGSLQLRMPSCKDGLGGSVARLGLSLLAVGYLAACLLPSEPSDAELIAFQFTFEQPFRVPASGHALPVIRITTDGRVMKDPPAYHLVADDQAVVQVDRSGTSLLGVSRGSTSVRAVVEAAIGQRDTVFPVQVVVSSLRVLSHDSTYGCCSSYATLTRLGQTYQFRAVSFDARGHEIPNVPVTWSTKDSLIAKFISPGVLVAVGEGYTQVSAEVDSVQGLGSVVVLQNAAAVEIAPEFDTLRTAGRSTSYLALVLDSTNQVIDGAKPHWRSTDTSVARISPLGVATAVGSGTTRIIAQVGQAADTATLVVAQAARFLFVSPTFRTLTALADTARFTMQALDSSGTPIKSVRPLWGVTDTNIATVDSAGAVSARADGEDTVRVTVDQVSASATVIVQQEVVQGRIMEDSVSLSGEGSTATLHVEGVDRNGYPVTGATDPGAFLWRSRMGLVATVDSTGLVTAHGDGSAWIAASVKTDTASSDSALVTVSGAPQELIAFSSSAGIEVARADGSGRSALVPTATGPAWSSDGTRLAFERWADSYYDIYTSRADGSDTVNITQHFGTNGQAAWSPDGSRIAFWSNRVIDGGIFIANADGSNATLLRGPVQVMGEPQTPGHPNWAPDGTQIAFDQACNIDLINIDGTGLSVLTASVGGCSHSPAWSPDGRQLAFVNAGADGTDHLWLINVDGTGAIDLSRAAGATTFGDGSPPAWSPGGTQMVLAAAEWTTCYDYYYYYDYPCPGPSHLWVISRDGQGLTQITSGAWESRPSWRRAAPFQAARRSSRARP